MDIIKIIRKHKYPFILDKRRRFAIQSIILTVGLLVTQLIWEDYRFLMVGILSILSYLLTVWSLYEDISGIEWFLLFILPVSFTASVSLFYFLLPGRWITRIMIGSLFAVGTYAMLLVENIYNVAAERSIQLLRAAQSVGLLLTLSVVFLSNSIIFSIRTYFWLNFLLLAPVIFILAMHAFWTIRLEDKLNEKLIIYSFLVAVGVGELVIVLSFWPIQLTTSSLFITAAFYALVGIIQQHLLERLFKNTIKEYIFAFIFTMILAILTTRWG